MPAAGIVFIPSGATIVARTADGAVVERLTPGAPVTFQSAAGMFSEPAGELAPDFAPTGSAQAIDRWYADRDRLARITAAAPVRVTLGRVANAPSLTLHPRPRNLLSLSSDVWLLLVQGFVIGLLGVGVAALRPRDRAARLFALSCLGVFMAAFSGAQFDARELTAPGALLRWAQGVNFIGSDLSSASLIAMFLTQPKRLAPSWVVAGLLIGAVGAGLVSALGWAPLSFFYVGLLVLTLGFFIALALQWVRSTNDPEARAILRWVAVTTFLGSAILAVAMAAPQLLGVPSVGGDGLSFLPLFVVYGGIAVGIARFRLFELDRWSLRILIGTAGTLALLAADALLIGGLGLGGPAALGLSVLLIANIYFPARALLWRWIAGGPALSDTELFQSATEVAFAPDPQRRREQWRALLSRLFDPLELAVSPNNPAAPTLTEGGVGLLIPATSDEAALVLRYRSKGRKLFDNAQLALAGQLLGLMGAAEATRDEYNRGVREERERIARDLHDDVNARLLTSLHREDVSLVRTDVRKAMSEIRTIISSLAGEQMALDQVMADLRYETAERLRTAGIELHWPLPAQPFDARLLDYQTCKALTSSHREIISNVLQHARATRLSVAIDLQPNVLHLAVVDNGCGLRTDPAQRSGNGLRNIESRLGRIGGQYRMVSTVGGVEVEVTVPLSPAI